MYYIMVQDSNKRQALKVDGEILGFNSEKDAQDFIFKNKQGKNWSVQFASDVILTEEERKKRVVEFYKL